MQITDLIKRLQTELDLKYIFVGRYDEEKNVVRTTNLVAERKVLDNFEYDLTGTPCRNVLEDTVCFYPKKVQDLFPKDELLLQMGIHSYVGVPLRGYGGRTIGLLVGLSDKEMKWETSNMVEFYGPAVQALFEIEVAKDSRNEMTPSFQAVEGLVLGYIHDLKNMMTASVLNSKLIEKELSKLSGNEEAVKLNDLNLENVGNVANLLEEVTSVIASHASLDQKPISLKSITEFSKVMEPVIPEGIKLNINIDEVPHRIQLKNTLFQLMLSNLIFNARDAVLESNSSVKEINITSRKEKTSLTCTACKKCTPKMGWWIITVEDSAGALDIESFNDYFREGFTQKATGNGLGLSLVNNIIHDHLGHITVEGGNTTKFSIYISCQGKF